MEAGKQAETWARVPNPIPAAALHPDEESDPHMFLAHPSEFGVGTIHVVFGQDSATGEATLHPEFMPLTLRRRRMWRGVRRGER